MELQHLDVKLPLETGAAVDLEKLIPIFHDWIREGVEGALLIDVGDYRHVPGGPGVMLIGHDGNFSLDRTDNRPGLRYSRKTTLAGTNGQRLAQALGALAWARRRLEADPALQGRLRFNRKEVEIRVNDRHLAPNVPETFAALEPELVAFFHERTGNGGVRLSHEGDPRGVFRVVARAEVPLDEMGE